jgi:hypothetical protein
MPIYAGYGAKNESLCAWPYSAESKATLFFDFLVLRFWEKLN